MLKLESVRPEEEGRAKLVSYAPDVGLTSRGSLGLTGQEAVKLHKELEVDIVALGRLTVRRAHVVAVEINSYEKRISSARGSSMLNCGCSAKEPRSPKTIQGERLFTQP